MATLSDMLGKAETKTLTESERAVKTFFDNNEQKKYYEKKVKESRKEFDKHFKPGDKVELENIGIKVNYSEVEKVGLDQEKLLEKVKELDLKDCVKTIEIVDEKLLQQKILDGDLDPTVLLECQVISKSSRLSVARLKK